jgi:hypothetical protein
MAEALSGRRIATGGVAENDKVYQRPEGAPIEFFQPVQWVMFRERGPGRQGRPT